MKFVIAILLLALGWVAYSIAIVLEPMLFVALVLFGASLILQAVYIKEEFF